MLSVSEKINALKNYYSEKYIEVYKKNKLKLFILNFTIGKFIYSLFTVVFFIMCNVVYFAFANGMLQEVKNTKIIAIGTLSILYFALTILFWWLYYISICECGKQTNKANNYINKILDKERIFVVFNTTDFLNLMEEFDKYKVFNQDKYCYVYKLNGELERSVNTLYKILLDKKSIKHTIETLKLINNGLNELK